MASSSRHSNPSLYGWAATGLILAAAVALYPEAAFEASLQGLNLWFDVVFPALFPFFALCQLLMGLGVIHGLGVLLEPLMQPVFRLPGPAAFAVAMGLAAGYPLGAKITGDLRRRQLCTAVEAERLVSFANTADPLFISAAVALSMFRRPELAGVLSTAHYLAALCVGLLMRFHGAGGPGSPPPVAPGTRPVPGLLPRALAAMVRARRDDGRPLGTLFADAIQDSLRSMLFIGGSIILFNVILQVATLVGFIGLLARVLAWCLAPLGADHEGAVALVKGLFEITLGAREASGTPLPLPIQAALASWIIGWSGFSVHAQVAAMLHDTDVRLGPYVLARFLHACLAALFSLVLLGPAGHALAPVMAPMGTRFTSTAALPGILRFVDVAGTTLLLLLGTGVAVSAAAGLLRRPGPLRP